MLPKFLESLTAMPNQLQAHVDQHELQAASRILHSLKGLAATMGAMELSTQAAKNEKLMAALPSPEEAQWIAKQTSVSIEKAISSLASLHATMQVK
jgi:chemotaxis protein histidine kinase CheA